MNILKRIILILSVACIVFPAHGMEGSDGNQGFFGRVWDAAKEHPIITGFVVFYGAVIGHSMYGSYKSYKKKLEEDRYYEEKYEEWKISSDDVQRSVRWYSFMLDARREDIVDTLCRIDPFFHNMMRRKIAAADRNCYGNDAEQCVRKRIKNAIRAELTTVSFSEIQHVIPAIIALTIKPNNLGKDIGRLIAVQLIPEIVKGKLAVAKKCFPNVSEAELQQRILLNINRAITSSPSMQPAKTTNIE